jgi:hypothetical protein
MPLSGPPDVNKLSTNRDVSGLSKALIYPKDARLRKSAAEGLGRIGDRAAYRERCVKDGLTHPHGA